MLKRLLKKVAELLNVIGSDKSVSNVSPDRAVARDEAIIRKFSFYLSSSRLVRSMVPVEGIKSPIEPGVTTSASRLEGKSNNKNNSFFIFYPLGRRRRNQRSRLPWSCCKAPGCLVE